MFLIRAIPAVGDLTEKSCEGVVRYSAWKCALILENKSKSLIEEEMNNTITDSEKPSLVMRRDEEREGEREGPG